MKELFKNTFPYFKKYMGIHVLCYMLGVIRMVVLWVEPQILSLIVDRVINPAFGEASVENSSFFAFLIDDIPKDDLKAIFIRLAVALLLLVAVYFVSFYIKWHVAHYFGIKSERELRKDALDKLNSSSRELLRGYSSGDLLTITNQDPLKLKIFYCNHVASLVDPVFYIVCSAIYLFKINIWLMIFPLVTGCVYVFITRRFVAKSKLYFDKQWKRSSELNTEIQESLYGIRTIKAYAREDYQSEIFEKRNIALRDTLYEFGDFRAKYSLIYSTAEKLLYIISLVFGIVLSVNMTMTSGEFVSFLSYILSIAGQFVGISSVLGEMQNSVVSSKRLFEFIHKPDPAKESYGTAEVSKRPHIQLKAVTVPNDDTDVADHVELLTDIDIDIPYGKKIGIMGKTGSGKSVLLKAVQSYIESDGGQMLIDGKPYHEYSRDSIRRSFGYAMQDVFLFSNTVSANIAYYEPQASDEKVLKCAEIARVDEFANKLIDGYDTIVGEKGFGLSGGQKQRVSIARALLKDAPVLVLDDCTSALDFETEKRIFKNIKEYVPDKTLLIATHRVSAIKDMDEIIFLEDGKIAERGTHEELVALGGRYAEIYHRQSGEEVLMDE